MTRLVYASSNSKKMREVADHLRAVYALPELESPEAFKVGKLDIPETGETLEENAELKLTAYLEAFAGIPRFEGKRLIFLSDDTGLFIKGLGGKPGIHVRRPKDQKTELSGREIGEYTLSRMHGLRNEQRAAYFETVVALGVLNGNGGKLPQFFSAKLEGRILEAPNTSTPFLEELPYSQLFYVPEWKMTLGQFYLIAKQERNNRRTHRERAVDKAVLSLCNYL